MDMVSSHYASSVLAWLDRNRIQYPKRTENAPNVPQARPIEKFWALCKAEYSKLSRCYKTIESFRRKWREISAKVASSSGEALMDNIRTRIFKIGENGVYSYI